MRQQNHLAPIRFAPRPKLSLKGSLAGSPVGLAPPIPANEPACSCGLGLQRSRRPFDQCLRAAFSALERSWPALGASWTNLGPLLAPLGAILARCGPLLGPLGASWTALGALLAPLGAVLARLEALSFCVPSSMFLIAFHPAFYANMLHCIVHYWPHNDESVPLVACDHVNRSFHQKKTGQSLTLPSKSPRPQS